ncbi:histone acetyltransferases subunit 3-domain-containing protein [Lipomyces kononenkoae]|uniref:Histone acetyltransferases subunit 3-domain-containing protein n=1 Tax=Lipomyces kononenkoae TaxID=34357 RepID=A0ACC3SVT0_LIPKO
MLPAGKSKGKGKGKGKGKSKSKRRNSAASDLSETDDSPVIYTDLLATYLSTSSSASSDTVANGTGGGVVQIPSLSALVALQNDLKALATKAQARVLRSQKLLRNIESQRTNALVKAQEADAADAAAAAEAEAAEAEAAAAAAAARELAEQQEQQRQLEEDSKKRGSDELETSSKPSGTPVKPNEIKEEESESRVHSPKDKKRRLESSPTPAPTPTASAVVTKPASPSATTTALKAPDEADDVDHAGGARVKNPGSEYVSVQTIPTAALAFMEDTYDDQIPTSGTEDMKKRYGVASYPTKDLAELLPGEIPDEDFSRAKPANQVQFSTFQSYIEPYYRPFVEEDLSFLNEKQDSLTPYLIPPLGANYQEIWAEEDGSVANFSPAPTTSQSDSTSSAANILPSGTSEHLTEDHLETEDISCGPLAARILSALLKDESDDTILPNSTTATPAPRATTPSKPEDENATAVAEPQVLSSSSAFAEQQGWRVSSVKADYQTLEDRLKREFKFIGILGDDEVDWSAREDDEVCAELRRLQKRLKVISVINAARKKKVEKIVHEHMAYQEYTQILEDLDKQVDQAYLKRTRTIKNKKKRAPGISTPNGVAGGGGGRTADLGEGIKVLLDKRKRWINKIGPVFPPAEVMKRIPRKSIFEDTDAAEKKDAVNFEKVDGHETVIESQA